MEQIEFKNACTEVLEILKYVQKDDLEKIPKSEIENLKIHANTNYNFKFNPQVNIKEQNVSKMAKAIIAIFFTDYIATQKQKEIIYNKQRNDEIKIENQKRELYNYDNIFDNKKEIKYDKEIQNSNLPIITRKNSIFNRFIQFIKKIFIK